MTQICNDCGRRYDDEVCSTICPHKGLSHCAVCDMVVCVCPDDTTHPRSNKFKEKEE